MKGSAFLCAKRSAGAVAEVVAVAVMWRPAGRFTEGKFAVKLAAVI